MERETKSKDLRGIRPFDAITGVFITVLSVFALLQTNKLESLRREVMELKEINPGHNGNSFDKSKNMQHQVRLTRSIVDAVEGSKLLKTLERQAGQEKECKKIICKGQKGDRGPKGEKGETGIGKFVGEVKKVEKGQKGDKGPRGPPGPSLERPRILEGPTDEVGNEGGSATFSCKSQGNPKPDVSWKINGMEIKGKNDRMKIDRNGILRILNLEASDRGTVKCTAKNFFGEASEEAKLKVNTISSASIKAHRILVNVNGNVEIACTAIGIPPPAISWNKEGGNLPQNAKVTDDGTLAMQTVQEQDNGVYQCVAENPAGKAWDTVTIIVRVPPTVDVKLKEVLSYVGNAATELVCEVSGIPKPQISWYRVNSEMPAEAEVNEDGNLVLKNLSRDDAGAYKCVAINDLGASDGLTEVRVQDMSFGMRPKDCKGVMASRNIESGKYLIWIDGFTSVPAYCDMTTNGGGWTVIQRRLNDGTDFDRKWKEYVKGFGELSRSFWMGLENIHQLTKHGARLRIELEDFTGDQVYAEYSYFKVGAKDNKYSIHVYGYAGNATDSMSYHNGMPFSTKDKDNDKHDSKHCAVNYSGGWWYRGCHQSNLNGIYPTESQNHAKAISWYYHRRRYGFIKMTEMKIRNGL